MIVSSAILIKRCDNLLVGSFFQETTDQEALDPKGYILCIHLLSKFVKKITQLFSLFKL